MQQKMRKKIGTHIMKIDLLLQSAQK